jgi:hypothetical protein
MGQNTQDTRRFPEVSLQIKEFTIGNHSVMRKLKSGSGLRLPAAASQAVVNRGCAAGPCSGLKELPETGTFIR